MEEIINKWQAEIIKDQEDNNIKTFLDIIKDKIDKDFYIKILDAEQYQDTDEINNLNQQIEEIEKKIKPLREQKQKDDKQLFNLLNDKDQLEQELKDKKGKSIDFGKLQKIKDILIDKCKTLQQEQNESQIKFEFSLKLNAEMQDMYNKIIQHQDEICSQILCMMTNIILKDLLKDDSEKKIDDIIKISKDIQNQIKNYNQKEDHNIFQFFDYLSEQFQDIFQAQHLMNEQIKQLKIVDLISGLVENGKKINKIKILILDEHLEKLIQAYTNVQNIKLPFLEWIGKHLKILYARIFSSKEKVDELKSDYLVRLEKLKFLNLKIEYNKPNS